MTDARQLARSCDQYVSALWRGETEEVTRFSSWLRSHWALGPEEPEAIPAAYSAVGGGGAGIRWHERNDMIYGYIPGVEHGCYQVPRAAIPPAIPTLSR